MPFLWKLIKHFHVYIFHSIRNGNASRPRLFGLFTRNPAFTILWFDEKCVCVFGSVAEPHHPRWINARESESESEWMWAENFNVLLHLCWIWPDTIVQFSRYNHRYLVFPCTYSLSFSLSLLICFAFFSFEFSSSSSSLFLGSHL